MPYSCRSSIVSIPIIYSAAIATPAKAATIIMTSDFSTVAAAPVNEAVGARVVASGVLLTVLDGVVLWLETEVVVGLTELELELDQLFHWLELVVVVVGATEVLLEVVQTAQEEEDGLVVGWTGLGVVVGVQTAQVVLLVVAGETGLGEVVEVVQTCHGVVVEVVVGLTGVGVVVVVHCCHGV